MKMLLRRHEGLVAGLVSGTVISMTAVSLGYSIFSDFNPCVAMVLGIITGLEGFFIGVVMRNAYRGIY